MRLCQCRASSRAMPMEPKYGARDMIEWKRPLYVHVRRSRSAFAGPNTRIGIESQSTWERIGELFTSVRDRSSRETTHGSGLIACAL